MASAVQALAQSEALKDTDTAFKLSVEEFNDLVESMSTVLLPLPLGKNVISVCVGESGLPAPDLMIVHSTSCEHRPLELHGFPPWQIRLTEI
jgi:undecaprenyl pyrophosphate synthase